MGKNHDSAHGIVEQLLTKFRMAEMSAVDLEFCADLALWTGFCEDAVQLLNAAFERLRMSDNFMLIHRILAKLCEAMKPDAFNSTNNYAGYLTARSWLAWATWNVGSLTEARNEFSRVATDAIKGTDAVIEQSAAEAFAADAERRVLGINLDLEDIPGFVSSAERALTLKGDIIVFNSIMNRLILYCARFSHVDFGFELAHLALSAFGAPEPESSGAVLCSDIGALFCSAMPPEALALYRRGVQLASDARQRIHNELDVFITETTLGRQIDDEEINVWRRKLVTNNLRTMLARFDLFRASVELRNGRFEQAQRLYQHAETTISIYKYEYPLLAVWNDAMIASLMEGNFRHAHLLQARLVARISKILHRRSVHVLRLASFVPAIKTQITRFSHLAPLKIDVPSVKPVYSGIFPTILMNLENLAHLPGAISQITLRKAVKLLPPDINHSRAADAVFRRASENGVEFKNVKLALCAQ
jgi:tetratricopeptide (TPR) repeat protein